MGADHQDVGRGGELTQQPAVRPAVSSGGEMARRTMGDSRSEAEKAFKAATTKPPELPAAPAPPLPGAALR